MEKEADIKPTLEHVQHPFRNNESSSNVDTSQQDRECAESLGNRSREVSTTHDKQSTDTNHTRDRIRNGHERRVELRRKLSNTAHRRKRHGKLTAGVTPQTTR